METEYMAKASSSETKRRHTYFFKPSIIRKIKYIAVQEGEFEAGIMERAAEEFISKWEKENGKIKLKEQP
jgi:hypothetical protein